MGKTPNIIIIVLDAVRSKNLPFYGYRRDTTPFLSSIKNELAVYENAVSSSYWTLPSIAGLFTGMYTSGHGLLVDGSCLDKSIKSLPEILKENGYRCGGFVRNVYVSEYSGLNRGFDDFYTKCGIDRCKEIASKFSKKMVGRLQPPGIAKMAAEGENNGLKKQVSSFISRMVDVTADSGSSKFVDDFSGWIERDKGKPFFAFFQFLETHSPYRAPFGHALKHMSLGENIKRLSINHDHLKYLIGERPMTEEDFFILNSAYDNSISYADHLIGKIFSILKRNNLYEDTWVIVTADHGDNIGDHGLMFHYFCLYDTLIKIPLLMKYPSTFGIKGRISETVQNVDIFPAVLSALNIQDEKALSQVQGNDLLGRLPSRREKDLAVSELIKVFGPERLKYKSRLSKYDRRLLSLREPSRKFIYSSKGDHEYYNLKNDPQEMNNLYNKEQGFEDLFEKASNYYKKMDEFYLANKQKIDGTIDSEQIDDTIADKLKSLGYM